MDKADPVDGARKAIYEWEDKLARRLNKHRKNIEEATTTLRVEDCEYRALVVQTGWQVPPMDSIDEILRRFLEEVS